MGKATTSNIAAQGTLAMRSLTIGLLAATAFGAVSTARAADLDYGYLRGADEGYAEPAIDWSGAYFGGHGGYTSGAFGFNNVAKDIVGNVLRQTTIENELSLSTLLSAKDVRNDGGTFGAFAGYNMQFDDLVIGIEVDYTRANLFGRSGDAIARQAKTSDGFANFYSLYSESTTHLQDFGTVRARAGYAIDNFLPFVTAGLAIGRARISDEVGIQTYGYDDTTYKANQAITDGSAPAYVRRYGYQYFDPNNPGSGTPLPMKYYSREKTKTVGGVALGGGLEYAITSNVLLRGEYQYVLFNDFDGHQVNMNTVRGGAALKF